MRSLAGILLGSLILLGPSLAEAGCLHRRHGCCQHCGTQRIVVHVCKTGDAPSRESTRESQPESTPQPQTYTPARIVESYPVMQFASYTPVMMAPQMPQMVVQQAPARESAAAAGSSCDCDRIYSRLTKLENDMDRLVDLIGKNSQAIERVAQILKLNKEENRIIFDLPEKNDVAAKEKDE